jgi:hypothetical protein
MFSLFLIHFLSPSFSQSPPPFLCREVPLVGLAGVVRRLAGGRPLRCPVSGHRRLVRLPLARLLRLLRLVPGRSNGVYLIEV